MKDDWNLKEKEKFDSKDKGYYDFVECLKMILRGLPYLRSEEIYKLVSKETDVYILINLILKLQRL